MSEPIPKPVQGEYEESLAYNLRVVAWKRKERIRKRRDREMAESAGSEAEAAEPEEEKDLRTDVSEAYDRSAEELEKMGQ